MTRPSSPAGLPSWRRLELHCERLRGLHLRELFADDPGRLERCSLETCGMVPCDFIVAARSQDSRPGHQEAVLANALAQIQALMRGRTGAEVRARPS